MEVEEISALHTISFTNPRLYRNGDGDFCIYFALETAGAETLVTDLALFIQTLGRRLIRWSVLGSPDRLGPNDPAHPVLRDLAYCWDGVACAYGVLQFGASPASVMNIRRMFHQKSQIYGPFCQVHRYEYFASGIFSDVEQVAIPQVFTEIEVAAQYVYSNKFLLTLGSLTHGSALGSCAMIVLFSLMRQTAPNAFHGKPEVCYFSVLETSVFRIHKRLKLDSSFMLLRLHSTLTK